MSNSRNRGPLSWVVGEQTHNKIFKGTTQAEAVDSLEIIVIVASTNHVVVLVPENLRAMGELTLNNDKQKDAHREQINLGPIVDLLLENFGCNVAWRAHGSRHLAQVARVTQSQVDKLEGQVAVNEDVL